MATVIPHLKILAGFEAVEKIIFCSIERTRKKPKVEIPKVKHVHLVSRSIGNVFVTKSIDLIQFPRQAIKLCNVHKIDMIICRSSPAGVIGHIVSRQLRIPYIVESFEPHADYMLEARVWMRYDPRFLLQKYFESKQKQASDFLLPVSHQYKAKLLEEGIPEAKIVVVPCCVALEQFAYHAEKRSKIRVALNISNDAVVGIYAGKFGGIYFDKEAFQIFHEAFLFFGDKFRLILLTDASNEFVQKRCAEMNLPLEKVVATLVPHNVVPSYLSAADFAFSTIKPSPSRIYCSPIKNAEYWANGLPVLLCSGIGDDSEIIETEGGGVLIDMMNISASLEEMKKLIERGRKRNADEISLLARKHRDIERVRSAYRVVFNLS